uniref:Uncharacterized protein n=1 Tax=Leersia perrieri TaxID=77586 RepID=A0A0D9WF72_9ORYZ
MGRPEVSCGLLLAVSSSLSESESLSDELLHDDPEPLLEDEEESRLLLLLELGEFSVSGKGDAATDVDQLIILLLFLGKRGELKIVHDEQGRNAAADVQVLIDDLPVLQMTDGVGRVHRLDLGPFRLSNLNKTESLVERRSTSISSLSGHTKQQHWLRINPTMCGGKGISAESEERRPVRRSLCAMGMVGPITSTSTIGPVFLLFLGNASPSVLGMTTGRVFLPRREGAHASERGAAASFAAAPLLALRWATKPSAFLRRAHTARRSDSIRSISRRSQGNAAAMAGGGAVPTAMSQIDRPTESMGGVGIEKRAGGEERWIESSGRKGGDRWMDWEWKGKRRSAAAEDFCRA